MALPMLLGITTMMAQSFIDAWFLGRVGDRALAAYSFGFPILMIVTSVAIGLGAGTSSVVARAIGAEDHRRAKRLVTDSLILSFLITAIISVVGVLTINPLFRLLGAPDDMIPMIRTFMIILYSGVPFFVVGMVGTSGMRATGDTRLPSKIMISGAILNVILDPIFRHAVPVTAQARHGFLQKTGTPGTQEIVGRYRDDRTIRTRGCCGIRCCEPHRVPRARSLLCVVGRYRPVRRTESQRR
jgi:Na+-driven multidrug efflux pump